MVPQCLQLLDEDGVPIVDTRHRQLQRVAETELIGPDSKPTDEMDRAASIAVPLERQISFKFPTVITPSEQAEDVRHIQTDEDGGTEQVLTAKQAAKAYAGELWHDSCQAQLIPCWFSVLQSSSMLVLLHKKHVCLARLDEQSHAACVVHV